MGPKIISVKATDHFQWKILINDETGSSDILEYLKGPAISDKLKALMAYLKKHPNGRLFVPPQDIYDDSAGLEHIVTPVCMFNQNGEYRVLAVDTRTGEKHWVQ